MVRRTNILIFVLVVLFTTLFSCRKEMDIFSDVIEPVSEQELAVEELYNIMTENYFWYKYIPADLDYDDYGNPEELLEAIRYKSLDKWSFITTQSEFNQYFVEGTYVGFGLQFLYDSYNNFYVAFIFNDSPLYPLGVRRGWILKNIDGIPVTAENFVLLMGEDVEGVTKTLSFVDGLQASHSFSVSKKKIFMNTVLHSSVYNASGKNIGYLVLESFIAPTQQELDTVFTTFKLAGVNELIIDLRYNGGGRTDIANFLASYAVPVSASNAVFAKYIFNDKLSQNNFDDRFTLMANNLNLNKVVVIASPLTASASEIVINGLKPYMTVKVVGMPTHGKPVGMITFDYKEYVFVPIVFEVLNGWSQGRYFSGIMPDSWQYDDVRYDWASVNDPCYAAALNYLTTGSFKSYTQPYQDLHLKSPAPLHRFSNSLWLAKKPQPLSE